MQLLSNLDIAFIDIVEEMKTNPAKAKAIFKPNDMVYLKQDPKHHTGCNSDIRAILSTSGSKYKAFRNCIDLSAFADCKSLYELCARTAIGSLLYSDCFEYINCYDIDKKFPYFFEIISENCDRMIFQTRAILRAYDIIDASDQPFPDDEILSLKCSNLTNMMKKSSRIIKRSLVCRSKIKL